MAVVREVDASNIIKALIHVVLIHMIVILESYVTMTSYLICYMFAAA